MMKILLSLALLALWLLTPFRGHAQTSPELESVFIQLWPEYDRPEMLVIYEANLRENTVLPATLVFRLPARVTALNAAAYLGPQGNMLNASYDLKNAGLWLEVSLTTQSRVVQIEYYDPGLSKNGGERKFEFTWPGDYAVGSLLIKIQQPVGADNMTINGAAAGLSPAADGLNYALEDLGARAAGETVSLEIQYRKPNDTLTAEILAPQNQPQAETSAASDSTKLPAWLPVLVGGIGIALVGYGVYSNRIRSSSRKQPIRRADPSSAGKVDDQRLLAGYCHNCGAQAHQGDKFCRNCGTELRE